MPSRTTDASVEVGRSGAVESSREPEAVEPEVTAGSTAETPNPGPRVAGPRLPDRRSDAGKVALPPTRPGSVTGDGRTVRAPRYAASPSSPAPIDRGRGQVLLLRVEDGDLAGVLALLAAAEPPDTRDRSGFTPLMLAVIRGDSAIGDALLGRGASVNARNHAGQTPLMMAAINNNRAVAKRLLDRGANVNARTTAGWTALMYAAWKGYPDIVRLLPSAEPMRAQEIRLGGPPSAMPPGGRASRRRSRAGLPSRASTTSSPPCPPAQATPRYSGS